MKTSNSVVPSRLIVDRVFCLIAGGAIIEVYDFTVFAIFVPVFGHQFFPEGNSNWVAMLSAFSIYAVGNVARPFGGAVIAHFGDKLGRRIAFNISILLMAASTAGIAIAPTYALIGSAAPIVLLVLRVFQGFAFGGEVPGAWTYLSEHVPKTRLGLACGALTSGNAAGALLGIVVSLLVSLNFAEIDVETFGWRIPFLFGGVLAALIGYFRYLLPETLAFQGMQRRNEIPSDPPLNTVIQRHLPRLFICLLLSAVLSVSVSVVFVVTPVIMQNIYYISRSSTLELTVTSLVGHVISCFVSGFFIDYIGEFTLLLISSPLFALSSFMLYLNLGEHSTSLMLFYLLVGVTLGPIACIPYVLVRSFPSAVRFTGVAYSYNFSSALFGGLTPPAVTLMLRVNPFSPAYLILCVSLAAFLVSVILLKSEHKK